MRKLLSVLISVFMAAMITPFTGEGSSDTPSPRIILYTYFWQIGEDDRLEIGSLDEEGVMRTFSGCFSESSWPFGAKEQLEYLSHTEKFTVKKTLSRDEIFAVKSLLSGVEKRQYDPVYTDIDDGGTEESFAVRYAKDGEPEIILLGKSGIELFENTDPNAQALYLRLRKLFPEVPNDAYDPYLGPKGFEPVPLTAFLGLDGDALLNTEIEAFLTDSEEGDLPLELSTEEKTELISLLRDGMITGKADCISSTGGVSLYTFRSPNGTLLGEADLQDGWLVTNDGRYYIEKP